MKTLDRLSANAKRVDKTLPMYILSGLSRKYISIPFSKASGKVLFPFRYRLCYNKKHFLLDDGRKETSSYFRRQIRNEDMGSAILYALGRTDYKEIQNILTSIGNNVTCIEQANIIKEHMIRTPNLVIDVGAGRGELSATLSYLNIKTIPIDPAYGSAKTIKKTYKDFYNIDKFEFINKDCVKGIQKILEQKTNKPDTVIFCESIEHISRSEFQKFFNIIKKVLKETHGILIITNFIDFHPIEKNTTYQTWEHIQTIDDDLYDELASQAKSVIFRRGSHLVLQF